MIKSNWKPTLGILSLQGDYYLHRKILNTLNVNTLYVNSAATLHKADGLIIPGGESTVMSKLLVDSGLDKEIKKYSKSKNIFGTCAGSIIMSSKCDDIKVKELNIIEIEALRNAWGRQIHSFTDKIQLSFNSNIDYISTFIRAPKVKILSDKIKILAFNSGK